ncbi:hypothetical protein J2W21_000031 [Sinomonas atrocyanea]|uniref:hypothetical protein n=1 Tax=Sinomonas atrocyanea TaxID=37927 RepID=UPI0027877BF3|nr:hypothetical protein [Sinomonas atrocyanea]MDP9882552.1 hypothetical protein [Sinomonas atrocyanea]
MDDTLAVMDLVYSGTVALAAASALFLALAFIAALAVASCLRGVTGALSRLASHYPFGRGGKTSARPRRPAAGLLRHAATRRSAVHDARMEGGHYRQRDMSRLQSPGRSSGPG